MKAHHGGVNSTTTQKLILVFIVDGGESVPVSFVAVSPSLPPSLPSSLPPVPEKRRNRRLCIIVYHPLTLALAGIFDRERRELQATLFTGDHSK